MFERVKNHLAGKAIDKLQAEETTPNNLGTKNKQAARIAALTGVQPNTLTKDWRDKNGKVIRHIRPGSWEE